MGPYQQTARRRIPADRRLHIEIRMCLFPPEESRSRQGRSQQHERCSAIWNVGSRVAARLGFDYQSGDRWCRDGGMHEGCASRHEGCYVGMSGSALDVGNAYIYVKKARPTSSACKQERSRNSCDSNRLQVSRLRSLCAVAWVMLSLSAHLKI